MVDPGTSLAPTPGQPEVHQGIGCAQGDEGRPRHPVHQAGVADGDGAAVDAVLTVKDY